MQQPDPEAEAVLEALAGHPDHVPGELKDGPWDPPYHVCLGCSDAEAGRWVPASFCRWAREAMEQEDRAWRAGA